MVKLIDVIFPCKFFFFEGKNLNTNFKKKLSSQDLTPKTDEFRNILTK